MAKIIIDGKLFVKPLSKNDIPHEEIPYGSSNLYIKIADADTESFPLYPPAYAAGRHPDLEIIGDTFYFKYATKSITSPFYVDTINIEFNYRGNIPGTFSFPFKAVGDGVTLIIQEFPSGESFLDYFFLPNSKTIFAKTYTYPSIRHADTNTDSDINRILQFQEKIPITKITQNIILTIRYFSSDVNPALLGCHVTLQGDQPT